MILHNDEVAKIYWGNTLTNPRHILNGDLKKFDKIVANPPYSATLNGDFELLKTDKYNHFLKWGIPPKSKIDYAFLEHMIESLKDNGKIVTLMPLGVLFRGNVEKQIRSKIIDKNLIESLILLPPNLFYGTSIQVCIFIINKNKDDNKILFINAENEFKKEGKKNSLTEQNIEKINNCYQERKEIKYFSKLIDLKTIQENDYYLNISRYVEKENNEKPIDIYKNKNNIKEIEKTLESDKNEFEKLLTDLGIIHE